MVNGVTFFILTDCYCANPRTKYYVVRLFLDFFRFFFVHLFKCHPCKSRHSNSSVKFKVVVEVVVVVVGLVTVVEVVQSNQRHIRGNQF